MSDIKVRKARMLGDPIDELLEDCPGCRAVFETLRTAMNQSAHHSHESKHYSQAREMFEVYAEAVRGATKEIEARHKGLS